MSGRPLREGDTVAFVAPSGPIAESLVESGAEAVTSWGLRVEVFDSVRARHPRFRYLAGTDEQRARDFQSAWLRPDIAAVVAARGGYGCQRMLDLVDWAALRAAGPKVFAGSSDTTPLHGAVAVHFGVATLFAPMPASTHFDADAAENLRVALFEPDRTRVLRGPCAETLVPGTATGPTVGGNLSLLAASIGTAEQRRAAGAIAILEDVGESVYRLDRLLTQLLRSGWFDGVAGIALGSWTDCGPEEDVRALMLDRLAPLGVPVAWRLGFGHHKASLTIPLGAEAELDADAAHLVVGGREC